MSDIFHAWSNGRWISLDLQSNRYSMASTSAACPEERERLTETTAKLRDCLSSPPAFLPPLHLVWHYARAAHAARFIRSQTIARQLDFLRASRRGTAPVSMGVETIYYYASVFQHLRNLRFRRPRCLEDSIGGYLYFYPYIPSLELLVGVKQPPFRAHAWLQSGDLILNDAKRAVEDYSVILRFEK
ncbi:lasso peptide biosynthesis B2 protein [Bradyrhizobium sp. CB1650]|uniref:lasso peptide biosynthesis B2 protein n=1 Tax=Bradyrhizobium sp. CB1650 TaxID=3039153 RepID=UPI0024353117|nr:lasso peptide biosynthesis B2 protein [Bradyrhizobium sp. CB1650]WGD51254.1 lasso peptide biosynthesis B2 protein [Bradyrhizobium sp. CB1650]